MDRKVDFTLAATEKELEAIYPSLGIVGFYVEGAKAADVGMKELGLKNVRTWDDIHFLTAYAMTAGYILGVRNERKRRKGKV